MKIFFLFLLLCFESSGEMNAQRVRPWLNLARSQRFKTEIDAGMNIEQEYMGIRYNTKMNIGTLISFQVAELDADTNYILSGNFEKIDIRVESPIVNMEVSSESAVAGDSLSIVLRSLLNKNFNVIISSKNEITGIIGLNRMIAETVSYSSLPGEQKNELITNLLQSIGEDALKDIFQGMGTFYPAFPVKSADHWESNKHLIKNGIPMDLSSRIIVKNLNKNIAVMISEGSIHRQSDPAGNSNDSLITSVTRLTGNQLSEIRMDLKTGLILESISSENISGSIKSSGDKGEQQQTVIPFKIVIRNSIHTYINKQD